MIKTGSCCIIFLLLLISIGCGHVKDTEDKPFLILSRQALKDKIKGGWAGQVIGVTYGGPYEFAFQGTYIQDYQKMNWEKGIIAQNMRNNPGLYDDLYMDLIFMDVIERLGIQAPADSFANAFAYAGFPLWHANQSARYNILNGIRPPASGHYKNNPHADDIDFQIESDFAGLMCPGMPGTAAAIDDKIGHIMCYGDGWYGGVFVSVMYTLAFTDVPVTAIVEKALKAIPVTSSFHQCISDVIRWHSQYPDWHDTWFALQKKWAADIGCPDGVFNPFDIDAKLNAAYVVIALLYGNEQFDTSINIAARCGQDADCNPSTVAGILGTKLGYEYIPAMWKEELKPIESIPFSNTSLSLQDAYETGYKQALRTIEENGGIINKDAVSVPLQAVVPVKQEQSFGGLEPDRIYPFKAGTVQDTAFSFRGNGIVIRGNAVSRKKTDPGYTLRAVVELDGKTPDTLLLPVSFVKRRNEIYWNYDLDDRLHSVRIHILDSSATYALHINDYLLYTKKSAPVIR